MTDYIIILLLGLILAGGTRIYFKARRLKRALFGKTDLVKAIKESKEQYEAVPKSIPGMTKLELPRIMKDFPEFSWPQWRNRIETDIRNWLEAIEHTELSYLSESSEYVRDNAGAIINENSGNDIHETYDCIEFNDTQIARYERDEGYCRILVKSSLRYIHTRSKDGRTVIDHKPEQRIFEAELIYVQDIARVGQLANSVSTNCPNCGAPVHSLGIRVCPFCGSEVEPVNIRVWKLYRISDITP